MGEEPGLHVPFFSLKTGRISKGVSVPFILPFVHAECNPEQPRGA